MYVNVFVQDVPTLKEDNQHLHEEREWLLEEVGRLRSLLQASQEDESEYQGHTDPTEQSEQHQGRARVYKTQRY